MRIALFIVFYVVCYVSMAFSESLSQSPLNGKWSKTLVKEGFQPDWSGFYSGLLLGGQSGHSNDKTGAFGYNADDDKWEYNESGLNAGAQLGYNYSWHQFVIGPEIELGFLGMKGHGAQPVSPGFDTVGSTNNDVYTAFRARLGVDLDRYLLFATGGAIGANYTNEVSDNCNIAPCGGGTIHAQKDGFVWGYTVGGGVEYLFEKAWSAKLECLYFNLDSQTFSGTTPFGITYDWTGKTLGYIIRGGINYHF